MRPDSQQDSWLMRRAGWSRASRGIVTTMGICGILAGIAIGLWGTMGAVVVLLLVILTAALAAGERWHWLLFLTVFVIAGVPHGAAADALVMLDAGFVKVYPTDILVFGVFVACIGAAGRRRTFMTSRWVGISVLAFLTASVASAVYGFAVGYSSSAVLQDLRPLLLYLGVFAPWFLGHEPTVTRDQIAWALIAGVAAISAVNVVAAVGLWGHAEFVTDAGRVWFRNGVLYPLAFPLLIDGMGRWRGSKRLLVMACSVVSLAGLVASGTRAYWLAVVLSICAYGLLSVGRTSASARVKKAALVVFMLLITLGIAYTWIAVVPEGSDSGVSRRIASLSGLSSDSSVGSRGATYVTTMGVIARAPFTGTGLGGRVSIFGTGFVLVKSSGQYVDNVPQTVALKMGVFGLIVFVWMIAALVSYALRSAHDSPDWLGQAMPAALVGLLVLTATSSYLVTYNQIFVLAVVLGAMCLRGMVPCESAT